MNKRGQFFLIAALVLVSILLSFGAVFNSSPSKSSEDLTPFVAESIKYEMVRIIENSYLQNEEDEIENRLTLLADSHSSMNPDLGITLVYGISPNIECYSKNSDISCSLNEPGKIEISENGNVYYIFNITNGYNSYVIVKRSLENERFIAYK